MTQSKATAPATWKARLGAATAAATFVLVSANAQPTNTVEITMDEPCSSDSPNTITVVLTLGKNTWQFSASRDAADHPWIGTFPEKGKTFSSEDAIASLRLKGTRTGCQPSSPALNAAKEDIAAFHFICYQQGTRNVYIGTERAIPVRYIRAVSATCIEPMPFSGGSKPYLIADVWVPGEELRIQLGWNKSKPADPGLIVLSANPKLRPIFWADEKDPTLIVFERAGKPTKRKTVDELRLTRSDVVDALSNQDNATGRISPNSIENDDERLAKAGLKVLTLKVK